MSALAQFITMYKEGKIRPSTMAKAAAFKEELEKQSDAGISTFLRYLATGLAVSAGMGVVAAGAKIGVGMYEKSLLENKKDELFKEVLKLHPDLQNNKQRALLYFGALLHFSPQVAMNPLTAGAYVRQALQYDHVAGGPLPTSINELAQIQKATAQSRKDAPPSMLGTVISGITEGPKMMPNMMTFGDYSKIE
jgi:hypothetical protein